MKIRLLLSLLFIVGIAVIMSCASVPQELSPEHEDIIGTKWFSVGPNPNDSLEFVDEAFCVFTSNGKQLRLTYSVKANNVIMGHNSLSYEIRENKLFHIGYPVYIKV